MLVRMKRHITGSRNGLDWPLPGNTIDVPDHEAADLIAAGHAVAAKEAPDAPTPEPDAAPAEDGDIESAPADGDGPTSAEDGERVEPDAAPAEDPTAAVKPKGRRPRKATA